MGPGGERDKSKHCQNRIQLRLVWFASCKRAVWMNNIIQLCLMPSDNPTRTGSLLITVAIDLEVNRDFVKSVLNSLSDKL